MQVHSIIRLLAAVGALGAWSVPAAAQVPLEVEVDLLEVHLDEDDDRLLLDSTVTIGEGVNQAVAKFAGGSETRTSFDDLEVQALYSRSVSDAVALHFGVRHDIRAGDDLTHGVAGFVVEPLPGFEVEHYFFISQEGDLTGGAQLLLGVDLAPNLALEPRLAFSWSAQDIPAEDLGDGLTDIEASVRLRFSLGGSFNIYTGVLHERLFGSTRDIAIAAGDPATVTRAILGLGFTL